MPPHRRPFDKPDYKERVRPFGSQSTIDLGGGGNLRGHSALTRTREEPANISGEVADKKTFETPVKGGRYPRENQNGGPYARGTAHYSSLSLLKQEEEPAPKERVTNLLPQPVLPHQS